jgi:hypothetical protein
MKTKLILFLILFIFFTKSFAQIDTNWVSNVSKKESFALDDLSLDFDSEAQYFALIVGVQDYEDEEIPDLKKPIQDADKLRKVLTDFYNFKPENTIFLKNAKKVDLGKELEVLAQKVSKKDNLLIFYAGHGEWDPNSQTGYWLPSDAKKNDKTTWFPNSILRDYVRAIPAKHILLITDACFGGSLFRGNPKMAQSAYAELNNLSSRKAMTSGALRLVPDESVFVAYLIRRLNQNPQKYLPAGRLYYSFQKDVMLESPGQTPKYGPIQNAGEDDGGEFIFERKDR